MILKLAQSFLLTATAALSTAAFPILPVLAQRTAQVQFQPGTSSAKLSGTITGQEYFDYILRAQKGQIMKAKLNVEGTNGNGSVFFNILPPNSQGEAIFNGSTSPNAYGEVRLPSDGEYTIRVYLMGNDRDSGKTVGYTVSVNISPSSSSSSSTSTSLAESNCLAAVARETGVSNTSTIRVERAESGIGVLVAVPGAQAPWQCVVDTDGKTVVNVYYTGSEGKL